MMMGKHMHCGPKMIGYVLVVVGAINWGLIGIGGFLGKDWNVVHMLLGRWPSVEWIVYILVGVAAVVSMCACRCKSCDSCQTCSVEAMGQKGTI